MDEINLGTIAGAIRDLAKPMEGPRKVKLLELAGRLAEGSTEGAAEILAAASSWGEGIDERFLHLARDLDLINYEDVEPTRDEEAPFADPVTAR